MIARLLAFLVPMLITTLITTLAQTTTPFASLVDDYLDRFAQHHPSIAAGNGIHHHDGQLEDFSAAAIAAEVSWLRATRSRLSPLDVARPARTGSGSTIARGNDAGVAAAPA